MHIDGALLVLILLVATALSAAIRIMIRHAYPYRRLMVARRVVANLDDGSAVDGVLLRQNGPLLVFANASIVAPGVDPIRMDGEVIVERSRVMFLQAP